MMYVLHIAAAFFFFPALFVTVPLHMILTAVNKKGGDAPTEKQVVEKEPMSTPVKFMIFFFAIAILTIMFGGVSPQ